MKVPVAWLEGKITVRPAEARDWRAARLLLPEVVHHESGTYLAVAEAGEPGRVIGAAAVSTCLRHERRGAAGSRA